MKKQLVFFVICCLFLFYTSCKKKVDEENISYLSELESEIETIELKKVAGFAVVNADRLRFRSDKDLHSKILRYLDRGEIVSIITKDNKRVRIGGLEDYWYQIEFEGIIGWVFGYYLDFYSSYENAASGSKIYQSSEQIIEKPDAYYDDLINQNLFFLDNARLVQVMDGELGSIKRIKLYSGGLVVNYFFSNDPVNIYYLIKQDDEINENGQLYKFDLKTEVNRLVLDDIYYSVINASTNDIILLSKIRSRKEKYWMISLMNIVDDQKIDEVTRIKINKENVISDEDFFSKTMERELGSLISLKMDDSGNLIHFKPPEEDQTYLVSVANGTYIQIDSNQDAHFDIDSNQFLSIFTSQDEEGKTQYNIVLNDKLSGMNKEVLSSPYYPINFSLSPKKNLVAITMLDLNKINNQYYYSSVYVLSLSTFSLMAISTNGKSYNPKWSPRLFR